MNQLFAAYARGKDARELMVILGEAALSEDDKLYAQFSEEFEEKYVSQGNEVNCSIEETSQLAGSFSQYFPRESLRESGRSILKSTSKKKSKGAILCGKAR